MYGADPTNCEQLTVETEGREGRGGKMSKMSKMSGWTNRIVGGKKVGGRPFHCETETGMVKGDEEDTNERISCGFRHGGRESQDESEERGTVIGGARQDEVTCPPPANSCQHFFPEKI